jgi:hypothetical protein
MRHPETRRFSAEGGISRGAHREFMAIGRSFCGYDEPTGRQGNPASVKLRTRSPFDALAMLACSGQALAPLVKARGLGMTPHGGTALEY